jgi:hypothetical protein
LFRKGPSPADQAEVSPDVDGPKLALYLSSLGAISVCAAAALQDKKQKWSTSRTASVLAPALPCGRFFVILEGIVALVIVVFCRPSTAVHPKLVNGPWPVAQAFRWLVLPKVP